MVPVFRPTRLYLAVIPPHQLAAGAMGRNIALVQLPEHIPADSTVFEGGVAQQYVDRPLLVDGRKFDCRVYVLVRSVWPLEIHVFQEGLARLASIPYRAPDLKNIGKQTMHLTNYSINKKEAADVSRSDDPITGCKRLITDVFRCVPVWSCSFPSSGCAPSLLAVAFAGLRALSRVTVVQRLTRGP